MPDVSRPGARAIAELGLGLEQFIEHVPHMVWLAASDGRAEYFNRRGTDFTGLPAGTVDGWGWVTLIHPDDAARAEREWAESVRSGAALESEWRVRSASGDYRWLAVRATPVRDPSGQVLKWVGTCTDIDDEKRLECSLRLSERESAQALGVLEALEASAPVGFAFIDGKMRFVRANETLSAIAGLAPCQLIGRSVAETFPEIWLQVAGSARSILEGGPAVLNLDVFGPTVADPGIEHHWLTNAHPVRIGDELVGVGVVVVDVTEHQEAADLRAAVMDNMAEGLCVVDNQGRLTYMNRAAGAMLGYEADELRGRQLDTMVHTRQAGGSAVPASACEIAKAWSCGTTVRLDEEVLTRKDGSALPVAISAAPLRSGATVRGAVAVFRDATEELAERQRRRQELETLTWVGRTREALDEHRLVLWSQPIVPLNGGEGGEELLLRMIDRSGQIVLPGAFLPAAERYGLIGEIDRWVIGEAARLAGTGRDVAFNLSAESIGEMDVLTLIERQLAAHGADPTRLTVELTETALVKNLSRGELFARGLADIGCGLALDDFGTGYASFLYLKRLSFSMLKIDREFVTDLPSSTANQHVVKATVSLARGFGKKTVAEGVEDAETLQLLKEYDVDFAQGYHLGRPAPLVGDGVLIA